MTTTMPAWLDGLRGELDARYGADRPRVPAVAAPTLCDACERVYPAQPWRGRACPGPMIMADGRDAMDVCACGCHDHDGGE